MPRVNGLVLQFPRLSNAYRAGNLRNPNHWQLLRYIAVFYVRKGYIYPQVGVRFCACWV